MVKKIEISYKTIVFTVFFLISLWLLYLIREIILQLFAALLIVAILNPLVAKFSRLKIPRSISVLLVYLLVIGTFTLGIAGVMQPLVEQTTSFANHLPGYLKALNLGSTITDQISNQIISQVGNLPGQILQITVSIFSNILSVITVLIFAFYLLLAHDKLDGQLTSFLGSQRGKKVAELISLLEVKLGGWATAQLTMMLLIGVASFLGYIVLGIPYVLPLAILAGIFEIVPYFGPIISGLPAVVIALSISPLIGLATASWVFLIHQLETYLFIPKVMEKSVGVSPIVTLIAIAVGFKVAGIVGIAISIPVVISLQIILKEYLLQNESNKSSV